ncbi:MAG: hypothetical protein NVSMB12_13250 [Acidimicrobiales bacterium]
MTRRAALFLRVFAGWTVFVWVVFIRNIVKDHTHTTGFKVVHITLAVISLAFAAGCFAVVARSRRVSQAVDRATSATPSGRP